MRYGDDEIAVLAARQRWRRVACCWYTARVAQGGSPVKKAVITSACRTAVARFLGALKGLQAPEIGAIVVQEAVRRSRLRPEEVDEVIMGNVLSAGLGQNPARQATLKGGLPETVPALTVNK